MKILVTGGSGFIGTELISQLLQSGYSVVNVDKVLSGISGIEEHVLDLTKKYKLIDGCDFCIHLASGTGGIIYNTDVSLLEYNAAINKSVLYMCDCSMLFMSSINVFEGLNSVTENPSPITPYAISKLLGEQFLDEQVSARGRNYSIVRPTNVFGKAQISRYSQFGESHVIPDLLHKINNAVGCVEVWGDGSQIRNFIHVKDVCRFVIRAMEKSIVYKAGGEFNICSAITISITELVQQLLHHAKIVKPVIYNEAYKQYEKIKVQNLIDELWNISTINSIGEGLNT